MANLIQHLFLSSKAVRNSIIVGVIIFVVESVLLITAGILDSSLFLDGEKLGVLEHPGPWGIVFGDMCILTVLTLLARSISRLPQRCPVVQSSRVDRYLKIVRRQIFQALFLNHRSRYLLLYMAGCGLLFWLNNAYQTLHPVKYYGNDLFDSINFFYGYLSVRFILGTSWIILIPYTAYCSLVIGYGLWKTLRTLEKHDILHFDIYHPDKCGGFSYFGNINILYVLGILIIYSELSIILLTHEKLNPGLLSGFILTTICFLGSTYVVLWPLNSYLSSKKKALTESTYQDVRTKNKLRDIFEYGFILNRVSFNPYPTPQRSFLAIIRLVPIGVSFSKLYFSS